MILDYLRQFMFWRTYYHFTNGDMLRDGRPLPKTGEWLVHNEPIVICESGLHACMELYDAFHYAPGFNLHLVKLSGLIKKCPKLKNKFVAQKRQIISSIDIKPIIERLLREKARLVAQKYFKGKILEHFLKEQLAYSDEIMLYCYTYEPNSDQQRRAGLFLKDFLLTIGREKEGFSYPLNYFYLLSASFRVLEKNCSRDRATEESLLAIYDKLQNDTKK